MGNVDQSLPVQSQWYYLDYLQTGVMVIDEYYRIIYWNRWLENHSNIISDSVELKLFKTVFPDLAESRLFDLIQQVIEERLSGMISSAMNQSLLPLYPSINHQLKQMDLMQQMVQVSAMDDPTGRKLAIVQVTDMSRQHMQSMQLKAQSKAMKALVNVDAATALANRQKFDESLHDEYRRAIRSKKSLVVAVVEIDHFEAFKMHYGMQMGSDVLSEVSAILESLLCRETDLIARFSNASFGLIMPCTTEEGGIMIAQEIRRAVKSLDIPHVFSASTSMLSVSVGIALAEPTKPDGEEAFARAPSYALKNAQEMGGDKAMFYSMDGGRLRDCDGGLNTLQQGGQLLLKM